MSEEGIFSVVYLSEGTRRFSVEDLEQILTKARETNSKLGISGIGEMILETGWRNKIGLLARCGPV